MLHELRTIGRGGGNMRELERRLGGVPAAVFQTEIGTAGETVLISEHKGIGEADPTPGEGRRLQTGGLADVANQRLEVLQPAPFMRPFEAQQLGRVWELRWLDFPPGGAGPALEALGRAVPHREEYYPVAGCWSVDAGPWLDRLYLLSPFKDWDHCEELMGDLRQDPDWLPRTPVAAVGGGSAILLPAGFSVWR